MIASYDHSGYVGGHKPDKPDNAGKTDGTGRNQGGQHYSISSYAFHVYTESLCRIIPSGKEIELKAICIFIVSDEFCGSA